MGIENPMLNEWGDEITNECYMGDHEECESEDCNCACHFDEENEDAERA
jgi:hypothetical protein